jgi:Cof subfamily protein (haloacid dehalogenase superfamily)
LYKLIALDIDGTLLNGKHRVTEGVKEAINKAREMGVKVILSSGRAYEGITGYINELDMKDLAISLNGAVVTDYTGKELIFSQHMDADVSRNIIKLAHKHGIYNVLFTGSEMLVEEISEKGLFFEEHDRVRLRQVGNFNEFYKSQPVSKMLLIGENQELVKLRDEGKRLLGDNVCLTFSLPYFLEAYSPLINKGIILEKVAKYYGIEREEVIAMGDGENDISMIKYAGLGIAMGNAVQSVKDAADFITATNDEDGVACAIEKFVLKS